jgi:tRNA A-37 threonylcarbamoyl transferase component Bud32
MTSSAKLKNANKLVEDRRRVLTAFNDPITLLVLHLLYKHEALPSSGISRKLDQGVSLTNRVLNHLEEIGLVTEISGYFQLAPLAKQRLDHRFFSPDFLCGTTLKADSTMVKHPLGNAYKIEKLIGRGATSFTFSAKQSGTHINRALKIFIPGVIKYDQLEEALKKRCEIRASALPGIIEAGEVYLKDGQGEAVIVPVVVSEFIDRATTFAEFLRGQVNPNFKIFERFVERVGGALAAIEASGRAHGDLHEGNILVVTDGNTSVEFWVIDFIGVPSFSSPELELSSDLENFRDHLLHAIIIACERYPGYSARYFVGNRVFKVLQGLREGGYGSFKEMLADYNRPSEDIPKGYFDSPTPEPFEWLRVEWIPSAEMLFKLFQPFQLRFDVIRRFGNTWLSGPRGCGKSHYLRILAFHPDVIIQAQCDPELADKLQQLGYDFRKAFGVLFTCRLGEFKMFVPEALGQEEFDIQTQRFLKHILVLKIWNRTLNAIKDGFEKIDPYTNRPVLGSPHESQELLQFLEERLGPITLVESLNPISEFYQILATCAARENSAISVWHEPHRRPQIRLLDESDLDSFFALLRRLVPDLSKARFYILVDDASYGQIGSEMQKVLNSLVRAVQANHCFKITFDRFMYTLDTADGRPLDTNNEGTYVDLGEAVTGTHRGKAAELSRYMAEVVNLRLKAANYKSDIKTILGESQDSQAFLSALSIPGARRPVKGTTKSKRLPRPKAYYAGWNIVWSISHGSVRTLLELIEHIFKVNEASPEIRHIALKDQDKAVRNFSNRRNKQLLMIPGEFRGEPLGRQLQAVISAIGEMSRQYLEQYDTGDAHRWYETISLERLDREPLTPDAQAIFRELINNGYLLDDGVTFARAQLGLSQRYDLNKIFAPAFQTTYRVRNHIYVSGKAFEELLVRPDQFVKRHKRRLKELAQPFDLLWQEPLFDHTDET